MFRRVFPEYLAAVAQLRSGLSDSKNAKGVGPFGLTQDRRDAAIKDPRIAEFHSADIDNPTMQVSVFAVMTSNTQAALLEKPGDFSFEEIYKAQFPDENVSSDDFDKALVAVEPLITAALKKLKMEVDIETDSTVDVSGNGPGGILGELIGKVESDGNYDAFNRGTAGDSVGQNIDLTGMTIGAIKAQQALHGPGRLVAVGKYQLVPTTLNATVANLGIQDGEVFTPLLQEKMFRLFLIRDKRPRLRDYIMGKHDQIDDAQTDLANEFASIPKPGGGSAHANVGGNKALTTVIAVQAAINAERDRFKVLVGENPSEDAAWTALSPALR